MAGKTISGCCDLHLHSTCSDGTLTPAQLVQRAREIGLSAISVTDHDTVVGVTEALAAGAEQGVAVVPGVEISVEYNSRTVHMLGYCFDVKGGGLKRGLDEIVAGRHERNRKIITKLNELGIEVTYDEVCAEAGGKVIGRPHFAALLIRKGYVHAKQEAFDRYLARGAAAYMERLRFSPEDSVAMIRNAGGVAVLAHPKYIPLRPNETLEDVVRSLVEVGLQGIECYYTMHTDQDTASYIELARRFDLMVTGGSDYHGGTKPEVELGVGHGNLRVPGECAKALLARWVQ